MLKHLRFTLLTVLALILLAPAMAGAGQAPEQPGYVTFETTAGDIIFEVRPDWSPLGAQRFIELVETGFYDGAPWFRVIDGFVAQCGIAADPGMNAEWGERTFKDEPVIQGNKAGCVAFGKSGQPDSRTTHIYINYADNSAGLDPMGFSCFAQVVKGMDIALGLHKCEWRDQGALSLEGGMDKFKADFPQADYILKAYTIRDCGSTGGIEISTDPPGAEVYIDDIPVPGVTPLAVTGKAPGSYRVACRLAGCEDATGTAEVIPGKTVKLCLEFADNPAEKPEKSMEQKQDVFNVVFETTKGEFVLEVHRDWSPIGADHFRELVEAGFYDGAPWFRVIDGFVAQCGIAADPEMNAKWGEQTIKDEPVVQGNAPGYVAFGKSQFPDSRSTHIFINYRDNSMGLDSQGFSCFARVTTGEEIAMGLSRCEYNDQYGLGQPGGLDKFKAAYPDADYILKAYIAGAGSGE